MKRFLIKSSILFFIILTPYVFSLMRTRDNIVVDNDSYLAAIIDKNARANSIQQPKIMLVGGSNLAFGMNSEKIENSLRVPVVNLGMYASFGLEFMVKQAMDLVKKDDIVILSIEHFLSLDGDYLRKEKCQILFPESSKYCDYNLNQELLYNLAITRSKINLPYLKSQIFKTKNDSVKKETEPKIVYCRQCFNKYGDLISHLKLKKRKIRHHSIPYEYWEGIDVLNQFQKFAKEKGAKVFFAFPVFESSQYNYKKNKEAIDHLAKDINNDLKIEVLNDHKDYIFDDSLFFDTEYHLNGKGRPIRTNMWIKLLNENDNFSKAVEKMQKH